MESKELKCELLTDLFAYGVDQRKPEFRASEIKGLMRYMYRIACYSELKTLYEDECALFGGAANKNSNGHASPIALMIKKDVRFVETNTQFLKHKDKGKKNALKKGNKLSIVLQLRNKQVYMQTPNKDKMHITLDWYTQMLQLTSLLLGVGARSRKARGSIHIYGDGIEGFKTTQHVLEWICTTLNNVNLTHTDTSRYEYDKYVLKNNMIMYDCKNSELRPLIQKIKIGEIIGKVNSDEKLNAYMKLVDKKCHDFKYLKKDKENLNTNSCCYKKITGNAGEGGKLASPLIISIIKIDDSLYPIYTYVKAVLNEEFDWSLKYRDVFVAELEKMEGGVD